MAKPYGKVNLIGLAMLAGIVGAIYWAFIYGPLYLDHMSVKTEVRGAYNLAGREKLEVVRHRLAVKLAQIGDHEFTDPDTGVVSTRKGLGIDPEGIELELNEAANEVRVSVTYERVVKWFPTSKKSVKTFTVTEEGPLLAE